MIVATCEGSLRKYWNLSGWSSWSGLSQPIYVSADLPNLGFVYVSRLNCDLILGVWITECNPKAPFEAEVWHEHFLTANK